MKRIPSYSLTAATLSVSCLVLTIAHAANNQWAEAISTPRMQHRVADHEALVDVRLGCLKAVLSLTPDQNQLWEAFEKAVRHATKMRRMDDVRQMLDDHENISSADRMHARAGRMDHHADERKEISEASKSLFSSLDDTQKRKFELGSDDGGVWLPENWDE